MGNGYIRGILSGTGFEPVRENPTRFQVKCVANMTLILYGGKIQIKFSNGSSIFDMGK
jgi:hypothetical protein